MSATTAVWFDSGDSHNTITFRGSNLVFNNGALVGGQVKKILLEDVEGADIAVFNGEAQHSLATSANAAGNTPYP